MRNSTACLALATVLSAAGSAGAQPVDDAAPAGNAGVGVGIESTITGVGGAAVVYDAEAFHITGILGFENFGDDTLSLAGRFVYVVHQGTSSDFGIGGGLAIVHLDPENPDVDSETDAHLELIAQLRAFVTPNVALSASLGAGTIVTDGEDVLILNGQLVGSVGLTYFFF